MKRLFLTLLMAAALGWGIWEAACAGLARAWAETAELTGEMDLADRAVKIAPVDAETHSTRGDLLQRYENYEAAATEFQRAVEFRPRDYYLWLLLGVTRDEAGDQQGALTAMQQAVELAPTYAVPRWQIGNLLLRMGKVEEAFVELRRAENSNPNLLPNVIDLAWGIYGDPKTVIQTVQPETDHARLTLALFFARHDRPDAALDVFREVQNPATVNTTELLKEMFQRRAFKNAYEVWARLHRVANVNPVGAIIDGGFESPLLLDEDGFGWQLTSNKTNVAVSLDASQRQTGSRSLRIEFQGDSAPEDNLVSQTVLVKPQTHYQLLFAFQSEQFVSGALPVISVKDASEMKEAILTQSEALAADQKSWREVKLDFSTSGETQAITISLRRQNCRQRPCPAFGILWLDSFRLQSLS